MSFERYLLESLPEFTREEVLAGWRYIACHPTLGVWQARPTSEPKRYLPGPILSLRIRHYLTPKTNQGGEYTDGLTEEQWGSIMEVLRQGNDERLREMQAQKDAIIAIFEACGGPEESVILERAYAEWSERDGKRDDL